MIEQGTAEWFAQRRGLFTSSEIENICKPKGLGDTGLSYIYEKLDEIVTNPDYEPPMFKNAATEWGNNYEALAANSYAKKYNCTIEEMPFVVHPLFPFWGGSADRKTYDNETGNDYGICEIKCPYEGKNHIKLMLIDSAEYFKKNFHKYYWQCVSNMIVTGTKYCDFISFDPRKSKQYGLFRFRLELIQEDADFVTERVLLARKEMESIAHRLNIQL